MHLALSKAVDFFSVPSNVIASLALLGLFVSIRGAEHHQVLPFVQVYIVHRFIQVASAQNPFRHQDPATALSNFLMDIRS
jgi:hypothetical protein